LLAQAIGFTLGADTLFATVRRGAIATDPSAAIGPTVLTSAIGLAGDTNTHLAVVPVRTIAAASTTTVSSALLTLARSGTFGALHFIVAVGVASGTYDALRSAIEAGVQLLITREPTTDAALVTTIADDDVVAQADNVNIAHTASHCIDPQFAVIHRTTPVDAGEGTIASAILGTGAAIFQRLGITQAVATVGQLLTAIALGDAQFNARLIPGRFAAVGILLAHAQLTQAVVAARLVLHCTAQTCRALTVNAEAKVALSTTPSTAIVAALGPITTWGTAGPGNALLASVAAAVHRAGLTVLAIALLTTAVATILAGPTTAAILFTFTNTQAVPCRLTAEGVQGTNTRFTCTPAAPRGVKGLATVFAAPANAHAELAILTQRTTAILRTI
jgi:hypothetical protein